MSPGELVQELRAGRLRPAYLLAGAEALLRDESVAAIRGAALGESASDFDLDRLEGDRASPAELLDALRVLPVLAPRRMVWLREPEASRRGGGVAEALADALGEVCTQEKTILVVTAERVDRRARWVKAFREPAVVVACDPPKGLRAVDGFAREEARRLGVRLGSGAAEALAAATGPQLLLLRQELEKAALLAGPGATVTREHVVRSASDVAEEQIFELTDAIGEGRTADALVALARLLGQGAAPPALLGALAGQFRRLLRASHGERLKGHPFAVEKTERQARRYSPARLRASLEAIHEVDEVLKGRGAVDGKLVLERLVMGLARA
jgi:DNA polymerase-3 subunit delta